MTQDAASLANYSNPLDNFRSYSYHFILTLSNTSQAFIDQIGGGTNSSSSSSSNQPAPLLSSVLQATKPGAAVTIGQSTVYLIADTRRFSQYSITELDMIHAYGTGDRVNPTTPLAEHHMQLLDTTGISFFNMLMDLFRNKVKSTRFSAFFLLAVIFIGHKDDGTTETVSTSYIPMMMQTMGLQFTASGSVITMTFLEQEGGLSRGGAGTDQMNYLGDCKSITTDGYSNTIGGMLDALQDKLNFNSLDFFQKYANAAVTKTDSQGNSVKVGKLVQYMINAPDSWRAYSIDTAEASSNSEKMYVATTVDTTTTQTAVLPSLTTVTPGSAYSTMKFSDATTIPDAIKGILESSTKILQLAQTDKYKNGQAIAFKIVAGVTSDETSFLVHYDVYPYYLPLIDVSKLKSQTSSSSTTKVQAGNNKSQNLDSSSEYENVITYNYVFTGQNNAIVALDVKFDPETAVQAIDTNINIGTQRFGQIGQAGQVKSSVSLATAGAKKSDGLYAPDIRANDPIFIPMKSKDQKNNNSAQKNAEAISADVALTNFNSKQQYTQTIASVHFLSNTQIDMTIRGNPNLIAKFADRNSRGGCAPHGQVISAAQVSSLTQSSQGTAKSNSNSVSKSLKTAKEAYYKNYYYPRISAVINPTSSKSTDADTLKNGPDVSVHPIYVVVKIKSPNVDTTGNYTQGSPMFTDDFFYNGVYLLLVLETRFQGGEFTHQLTLMADQSVSSQNDGAQ